MSDIRRGLIIVNTGPGKGKTTAAMGTALRAVGQGMRVLMLQFLKGSWHYGELDAVKAFGDKFVLKQMGRGFVKVGAEKPDPRFFEIALGRAGANPENTLHVGDMYFVDVQGARAAGIRAVLIDRGGLQQDRDCPRFADLNGLATALEQGQFD